MGNTPKVASSDANRMKEMIIVRYNADGEITEVDMSVSSIREKCLPGKDPETGEEVKPVLFAESGRFSVGPLGTLDVNCTYMATTTIRGFDGEPDVSMPVPKDYPQRASEASYTKFRSIRQTIEDGLKVKTGWQCYQSATDAVNCKNDNGSFFIMSDANFDHIPDGINIFYIDTPDMRIFLSGYPKQFFTDVELLSFYQSGLGKSRPK